MNVASVHAIEKVQINGLWYYIYTNYASLTSPPDAGHYSGDIVIPESIEYDGKTVPVTRISGYAFCYDRSVTSITIPGSVKKIGTNAFLDCQSLNTLTIPESVTELDTDPFGGCSLNPLIIRGKIDSYADVFSRMKSGSVIYARDSEIDKIKQQWSGEVWSLDNPGEIDDVVSYYDGISFRVKENEYYSGISVERLDVKIGDEVITPDENGLYTVAGLNPNSDYEICVRYGKKPVIHVQYAVASRGEPVLLVATVKKTVRTLQYPCEITDVTSYIQGISFKVKSKQVPTQKPITLKIGMNGIINNKYMSNANVEYGNDGVCFKTGLKPNDLYEISILYAEDGGVKQCKAQTRTLDPEIGPAKMINNKQTSIAVSTDFSYQTDETCDPIGKRGVNIDGKDYLFDNSEQVLVTGLAVNSSVNVYNFVEYGPYRVNGVSVKLSTRSVWAYIDISDIGVTSFGCEGSCKPGEAVIESEYFTVGGKRYDGNSCVVTGLKPNTKYEVYYTVEFKTGGLAKSLSRNITTNSLQLKTLDPKPVSSTCAIVAAETNIADVEPNVGFQWTKYDAPSSLKPSEGAAVVYDGQIEGYIKNLQPTSYYNVRAFYKSASGDYYYGEWVTFDPSDFSYFEPTVRTYPVQDVSSNTAKVRGYALAGSEDIIEQGFQYWISGSGVRMASRAGSGDVLTVLASGQVMTADLENLRAATTYSYRAFVKTSSGVVYGEEETFTTAPGLSGIDDIDYDSREPEVVGYYDLNGRCIPEPRRGVNIVRYSDGSARKIVVR